MCYVKLSALKFRIESVFLNPERDGIQPASLQAENSQDSDFYSLSWLEPQS